MALVVERGDRDGVAAAPADARVGERRVALGGGAAGALDERREVGAERVGRRAEPAEQVEEDVSLGVRRRRQHLDPA